MIYGEFQVVGQRSYRGHEPGTVFEARLERRALQRAVQRGDIAFLRETKPFLPPEFTFPDGWLPAESDPVTRGAERRLTR